MARTTRRRRRRRMVGRGLDVQKWLAKTGIEFPWPGINTWAQVPSWRNASSAEIPASTGWTALPGNTTLTIPRSQSPGQVESRRQDDLRHSIPPGEKDLDRSHGQENHASLA